MLAEAPVGNRLEVRVEAEDVVAFVLDHIIGAVIRNRHIRVGNALVDVTASVNRIPETVDFDKPIIAEKFHTIIIGGLDDGQIIEEETFFFVSVDYGAVCDERIIVMDCDAV